ncbi:MAG: ribokinase [Planctomycetota bacterium]|jgi:ribokinase|nr:ribokinase [Planctomycetota bacterium]
MPNGDKPVIAVIGNYAVGMTIECDRFPRPGETVKGRNFNSFHGGKGSNQAIGAARLGGDVIYGAMLGMDKFGDEALAMLKSEGINVERVMRTDKTSTGVGLIYVDANGDNEIVIGLGGSELISPKDIRAMRAAVAGSKILLLQLEANLEAVAEAIAMAHELGVPVILNPAPFSPLPDAVVGKTTYITPNETEAAAMLGLDSVPEGGELARGLHEKFGVSAVVTLGDKGAYIKTADLDRAVPGIRVETVDSTGAGDTFSSALAVALAEGKGLVDAVVFANHAAGLSVTVKGVVESIPYRGRVEELMAGK